MGLPFYEFLFVKATAPLGYIPEKKGLTKLPAGVMIYLVTNLIIM